MKKTKVETVDLGKKGDFKVKRGALHRALGIPEDETIGQARIEKALKSKNPRFVTWHAPPKVSRV